MTADERAYLLSQGISVEEPDSYVDPAEQRLLYPQGLPPLAQQGGLAQTATRSRLSDLLGGLGRPAAPAPPPPAQRPDSPPPGPGTFEMNDPSAIAEGQRAQRQAAAEAGLAHSTGQLVRLVATEGASSVTDNLGSQPGTSAGAGSGAGFGTGGSGSLAQLLGPLMGGGGNPQNRQLAMLLAQYGSIPWASG
jgi:hypothetical protein